MSVSLPGVLRQVLGVLPRLLNRRPRVHAGGTDFSEMPWEIDPLHIDRPGFDDEGGSPDGGAGVREPRRPRPGPPQDSVALLEPAPEWPSRLGTDLGTELDTGPGTNLGTN
jgi:hypothetical protein